MKRKQPRRMVFGEVGRVGVTYLGDLPFEHRGCLTDTNYVWNARHPTRWVDKRDLSKLVEAAGRELLGGVPEKAARKRKPPKSPPPEEVEPEIVEVETPEILESEEAGHEL